MKNFILLILLITYSNLFAEYYKISGYVNDYDSKSPLPGVTIKIENTGIGVFTNKDGYYEINKIKKGNYKLIVSYIGYQSITSNLVINENIEKVNFQLKYKPFETSEIIVSANKRVQTVQEVPISVSVIDQSSIKLRNITRVDDALRLIPGVNLNKDNVNIRGSSGFAFGVGSRVLLLMDGFPILSGDNGDMKFDAIPMLEIERIEVVKGAGSALYGSSALGGVINIITKDAKENLDINAKSFIGIYTKPKYEQWKFTDNILSERGFDISLSKKIQNFGINLSGGYLIDDSYRKMDDSKRYYFLSKFKYDIEQNSSIKLFANIANDNRGDWIYWNSLDSALIPPTNTDLSSKVESRKININSEFNHIFDSKNFLNIKVGIFNTFYNTYKDTLDSLNRKANANSIYFESQFNSILTNYLFLTFGLTFNRNNVLSNVFGINYQTIYGAYSQFEIKPLKDLVLTIGTRYDREVVDNINNQNEFTPKFGLSYKPLEFLSLRTSFGKGYRAPKAAERFASLKVVGFEVVPNNILKSEKSTSYEFGGLFEFALGDIPISLDFAVFHNNFEDLIEPTFTTQNYKAVIQFQNITKARITGTEINLKTMLLKNLGIEASLTYTDPIDLTLNETLKYRSKLLFYNRLFFNYNNFIFNLDYRYISKSNTIDEKLGLQVIDHDARVDAKVFDASINYNIKEVFNNDVILTLFAKNLFDYYYNEMPGNIALTRKIGFELKLNY